MIVQFSTGRLHGSALTRKVAQIMDIILHLGAHRCATTTLQTCMDANSSILHNQGITCWTPQRTRSGLFSGLIREPGAGSELDQRREQRSMRVLRLAVDQVRRTGTRHLLVSEENMIGAVRNNLRAGRLYPQLAGRLARFRDAFGASCTRIGIAVRSYDTYWGSALAYAVANGHQLPDTDQLDRLVTQPRRWRDVIGDIRTAFPHAQIVVWPFEHFADRPADQIAILGGQAHLARAVKVKHKQCNTSPDSAYLRRALYDRGQHSDVDRIAPAPARWMPFDIYQQDALRAQYQLDLAWLRHGASGLAQFVATPDDHKHLTERKRTGDATRRQTAAIPPIGGYHGAEKQVV